ncbi:MAG: hypothetical protein AB7V07_02355 [Candidatus Delongbacteria bacterium]
MSEFVKKIFLFSLIISLILSCMIYYLYRIGGNDLPAPKFSNSISFNEKIDFIRSKDLSKVEYIAVGSSMTLNNVDSETMVKYFGKNYLNLGSWGFKISDNYKFIREMADVFPDLKVVLISTGFMDFSSSVRNIEVDYGLVKNSVNHNIGPLAYLMSFDLKYLQENSKKNIHNKERRNSYQNLSYDTHGGAVLDIEPVHIDTLRWNMNIKNFAVSREELESLKELIEFLNSRGIKTCIAVSPQREGLNDKETIGMIKSNNAMIRSVIETAGGLLVDPYIYGTWPDSLFVDYAHLNNNGAVKYTEIITQSLKTDITDQ